MKGIEVRHMREALDRLIKDRKAGVPLTSIMRTYDEHSGEQVGPDMTLGEAISFIEELLAEEAQPS
jgi:hypothetical protein